MALYFLGFALVFVFGCGVPGSGGALCSYQGVVGENWFVKIKEVVHWVLAVSFQFLFIISSVAFWGNLLLLRELGVLTEQSPYICIYIYACCGVIIWSKFGGFGSYYLVQVCFF